MFNKKDMLKYLLWSIALWFYGISFWAVIDHFEMEVAPTKVKIWETVDLTITAVDKDGNLLKDYVWEIIIFSQTDPKAEFPWIKDNTYKFKASDAWELKFENSVKFTKVWTQDINVYDSTSDDIFGFAEVEVSEWVVQTQTSEITITYPEDWVILWNNIFKVKWKTIKNHKVKLFLNTDKIFNWISDNTWLFEIEIKDVPNWENSLKVEVLDADWKSIWKSSDTLFKIEASAPKMKSIKLTPGNEVDSETKVDLELQATKWLTNVDIILNDMIVPLTENWNWTYTWSIIAPKEAGEYKIDLVLKNELGNETKVNWVEILTVKKIELAAAEIPVEDKPEERIDCESLKSGLTISWIKLVKMKTKSVLSWDKLEKATSYNVYKKDRTSWEMTLIENISDSKIDINITWDIVEYDDFSVKAIFKDDVCDIESNDFSTMTKVQTWPKEIMLLVLFSLLTSLIFLVKRKKV